MILKLSVTVSCHVAHSLGDHRRKTSTMASAKSAKLAGSLLWVTSRCVTPHDRSIAFPIHDNTSRTSGVASNGSRSWRAIAPEASSPNSARVTAPPRCRYRPNAPRRGRPLCLFGPAQTGHDAKPRSSAFPTSCSRRECSRSGGLQSSGPSSIHFGTSARSSRLLMLNCMALWPNGGSRVSSAPRTYRGSRAWPFST